jgi:TRAP-type transport system periplasmic protein
MVDLVQPTIEKYAEKISKETVQEVYDAIAEASSKSFL